MRPVSTAILLRRWIALHPTHRIDAHFWLRVVDEIRRTIPPLQATDAQVRCAIDTVEAEEKRHVQ